MIVYVLVDGVHRLPIQSISNHRSDVVEAISQALNQSPNEFYLIQNGKLLSSNGGDDDGDCIDVKHLNGPICVHQRAFGGKGGFGSMLRAIGAQIEKTTNREACRDLSGRRLRDINEEKRLKDYLEKQKDRDDDEASKIARKIERLRSKPKHEFADTEYFETRSNLLDDVSNALEDGLKKTIAGTSSSRATATATSTSAISSGTESSRDQDSSSSNDGHAVASGTGMASHKRKITETMVKKLKTKKKKKNVKGALWFDEGLSSGDSSDDDDDDDDSKTDDKDKSNSNSSSIQKNKLHNAA